MLSALVDEADPPTKLFRSAATGRVAAVLVSADHLEFVDCRTKSPLQWLKLSTAQTLVQRSTNSMQKSTRA